MPNIHDMVPSTSKYLKKEDLPHPRLITIAGVTVENVALQGQPEEMKGILHLQEADLKPIVLNQTNTGVLETLYGPMTESWIGKQLVAWNDLSVQYQGNIGGIRLRVPDQPQPASAPQPAPAPLQQPAGPVPGSQPISTPNAPQPAQQPVQPPANPVQTNHPGITSPNAAPGAPQVPDEDIPW